MPLYRAWKHRRTSHSTVNNETVEAAAYRGQEHRDNGREDLGRTAWHGKRRDPGLGLHSPLRGYKGYVNFVSLESSRLKEIRLTGLCW